MLGLIGSLVGSVASGLFGMAGQSSANAANLELDSTKYQRASVDMQKAGLNPAAMYNGGSPGAPPVMQNTMAAPAAAMKDAASSAVAMKIADKTIDQLTEQIAKTNAEAANVRAGTPGIGARSDVDVMRTDAIKKIPVVVRDPIFQGGLGAKELGPAGRLPAVGAALGASGSGAIVEVAKNYGTSAKSTYRKLLDHAKKQDQASRDKASDTWEWWKRKFDLRENNTTIHKQ